MLAGTLALGLGLVFFRIGKRVVRFGLDRNEPELSVARVYHGSPRHQDTNRLIGLALLFLILGAVTLVVGLRS